MMESIGEMENYEGSKRIGKGQMEN